MGQVKTNKYRLVSGLGPPCLVYVEGTAIWVQEATYRSIEKSLVEGHVWVYTKEKGFFRYGEQLSLF